MSYSPPPWTHQLSLTLLCSNYFGSSEISKWQVRQNVQSYIFSRVLNLSLIILIECTRKYNYYYRCTTVVVQKGSGRQDVLNYVQTFSDG